MSAIDIAQIVLAVLLIVLILLQRRGTGLGAAMGGDSTAYATRRGAERFVFYASIVVSFLFFGVLVVRLVI